MAIEWKRTVEGFRSRLNALAYDSSRRQLLTIDCQALKLWTLAPPKEIKALATPTDCLDRAVLFYHEVSDRYILISGTCVLRCYTPLLSLDFEFQSHEYPVLLLATYLPYLGEWISGDTQGLLQVFSMQPENPEVSGQEEETTWACVERLRIDTTEALEAPVSALTVHQPTNQIIATSDLHIITFDLDTGEPQKCVKHILRARVAQLMCPMGLSNVLWASSLNGLVSVLSMNDGILTVRNCVEGVSRSTVWHLLHDEKRRQVLGYSDSGQYTIWDDASGDVLKTDVTTTKAPRLARNVALGPAILAQVGSINALFVSGDKFMGIIDVADEPTQVHTTSKPIRTLCRTNLGLSSFDYGEVMSVHEDGQVDVIDAVLEDAGNKTATVLRSYPPVDQVLDQRNISIDPTTELPPEVFSAPNYNKKLKTQLRYPTKCMTVQERRNLMNKQRLAHTATAQNSFSVPSSDVSSNAFVLEDGRVACGYSNGSSIIRNTRTGECSDVIFDPNSQIAVTALLVIPSSHISMKKRSKLASGRPETPLMAMNAALPAIGSSGKANVGKPNCEAFLVTGNAEGVLRAWTVHPNKCIITVNGHAVAIKSMDYIASQGIIVTTAEDSTIKVWHARTLSLVGTVSPKRKGLVASLLIKGEMVCGFLDGAIEIWGLPNLDNLDQEEPIGVLLAHTNRITSLIRLDENRFCSGSVDGRVIVWDIDSGEMLKSFSLGIPISAMCSADADGHSILFGTKTGIHFMAVDVLNADKPEVKVPPSLKSFVGSRWVLGPPSIKAPPPEKEVKPWGDDTEKAPSPSSGRFAPGSPGASSPPKSPKSPSGNGAPQSIAGSPAAKGPSARSADSQVVRQSKRHLPNSSAMPSFGEVTDDERKFLEEVISASMESRPSHLKSLDVDELLGLKDGGKISRDGPPHFGAPISDDDPLIHRVKEAKKHQGENYPDEPMLKRNRPGPFVPNRGINSHIHKSPGSLNESVTLSRIDMSGSVLLSDPSQAKTLPPLGGSNDTLGNGRARTPQLRKPSQERTLQLQKLWQSKEDDVNTKNPFFELNVNSIHKQKRKSSESSKRRRASNNLSRSKFDIDTSRAKSARSEVSMKSQLSMSVDSALSMNSKRPPSRDRHLRPLRDLTYNTTQDMGKDAMIPAYGVYVPGSENSNPPDFVYTDPEKARQYMEMLENSEYYQRKEATDPNFLNSSLNSVSAVDKSLMFFSRPLVAIGRASFVDALAKVLAQTSPSPDMMARSTTLERPSTAGDTVHTSSSKYSMQPLHVDAVEHQRVRHRLSDSTPIKIPVNKDVRNLVEKEMKRQAGEIVDESSDAGRDGLIESNMMDIDKGSEAAFPKNVSDYYGNTDLDSEGSIYDEDDDFEDDDYAEDGSTSEQTAQYTREGAVDRKRRVSASGRRSRSPRRKGNDKAARDALKSSVETNVDIVQDAGTAVSSVSAAAEAPDLTEDERQVILNDVLDRAAEVVQKNWRGHATRLKIEELHQRACTIQRVFRGFISRLITSVEHDTSIMAKYKLSKKKLKDLTEEVEDSIKRSGDLLPMDKNEFENRRKEEKDINVFNEDVVLGADRVKKTVAYRQKGEVDLLFEKLRMSFTAGVIQNQVRGFLERKRKQAAFRSNFAAKQIQRAWRKYRAERQKRRLAGVEPVVQGVSKRVATLLQVPERPKRPLKRNYSFDDLYEPANDPKLQSRQFTPALKIQVIISKMYLKKAKTYRTIPPRPFYEHRLRKNLGLDNERARFLGDVHTVLENDRRLAASMRLQRVWRGHAARIAYRKKMWEHIHCGGRILYAYRCYLARKELRRRKQEKAVLASVSVIQRVYRGYVGRSEAAAKRKEAEDKERMWQETRDLAATRIQKWFLKQQDRSRRASEELELQREEQERREAEERERLEEEERQRRAREEWERHEQARLEEEARKAALAAAAEAAKQQALEDMRRAQEEADRESRVQASSLSESLSALEPVDPAYGRDPIRIEPEGALSIEGSDVLVMQMLDDFLEYQVARAAIEEVLYEEKAKESPEEMEVFRDEPCEETLPDEELSGPESPAKPAPTLEDMLQENKKKKIKKKKAKVLVETFQDNYKYTRKLATRYATRWKYGVSGDHGSDSDISDDVLDEELEKKRLDLADARPPPEELTPNEQKALDNMDLTNPMLRMTETLSPRGMSQNEEYEEKVRTAKLKRRKSQGFMKDKHCEFDEVMRMTCVQNWLEEMYKKREKALKRKAKEMERRARREAQRCKRIMQKKLAFLRSGAVPVWLKSSIEMSLNKEETAMRQRHMDERRRMQAIEDTEREEREAKLTHIAERRVVEETKKKQQDDAVRSMKEAIEKERLDKYEKVQRERAEEEERVRLEAERKAEEERLAVEEERKRLEEEALRKSDAEILRQRTLELERKRKLQAEKLERYRILRQEREAKDKAKKKAKMAWGKIKKDMNVNSGAEKKTGGANALVDVMRTNTFKSSVERENQRRALREFIVAGDTGDPMQLPPLFNLPDRSKIGNMLTDDDLATVLPRSTSAESEIIDSRATSRQNTEGEVEGEVDMDVINIMTEAGFEQEYLLDIIRGGVQNDVTALYNLLLEKRRRGITRASAVQDALNILEAMDATDHELDEIEAEASAEFEQSTHRSGGVSPKHPALEEPYDDDSDSSYEYLEEGDEGYSSADTMPDEFDGLYNDQTKQPMSDYERQLQQEKLEELERQAEFDFRDVDLVAAPSDVFDALVADIEMAEEKLKTHFTSPSKPRVPLSYEERKKIRMRKRKKPARASDMNASVEGTISEAPDEDEDYDEYDGHDNEVGKIVDDDGNIVEAGGKKKDDSFYLQPKLEKGWLTLKVRGIDSLVLGRDKPSLTTLQNVFFSQDGRHAFLQKEKKREQKRQNLNAVANLAGGGARKKR